MSSLVDEQIQAQSMRKLPSTDLEFAQQHGDFSLCVANSEARALQRTPYGLGHKALGLEASALQHVGTALPTPADVHCPTSFHFSAFFPAEPAQGFWLQTAEIPVAGLSRKGYVKGY